MKRKRSYTTYRNELDERLMKLNKQIISLEKVVYSNAMPHNDHWFKKYSDLNELRIQRATVQSRLDGLGKDVGLPEYKLPQIQQR